MRMQGTLVRLFVVVSGLLFPKEQPPVLDQDHGIVTGMRRHEGLLQQERAKLEQEQARLEQEQAKAVMPKENPEGLESHLMLQPGDQDLKQTEISDPQEPQTEQELRKSSLQEKYSTEGQTEINTTEPPDIEYPQPKYVVHFDKDEELSDLREELPSKQEAKSGQSDLPKHAQSLSPEELDLETKIEKLVEGEIDLAETILSENIFSHEVETEAQASLSDFSDPEIGSNRFEGKSETPNGETLTPTENLSDTDLWMGSQAKPKHKPAASTESNYLCYLCNAYSLFTFICILLRHLRGTSEDQKIPKASQHNPEAMPSVSAEISVPDQATLIGFYNRYVHVPACERQRVCEFVEGFVDDLLVAIREMSSDDEQADVEMEDFLEVGSLYEAWCTGRTLTCDLWVPVSPREPYSFQAQLSTTDQNGGTESDIQGYGKVKVLKGGRSTANGCPCSQANEDSDMLCLLHTHIEKEKKTVTDATDGPLCCESTPYLSRTEVARWFRSTAHKAWEQMSHKYELELHFWSRESWGAWHVRFRSGRVIHFNMTPVVKFEDTDVYLVSHLSPNKRKNDDNVITPEAPDQWLLSFARYERNLLRYLGRGLPPNACHLCCLQILSFLNQKQVGLTGKSGLSSYHLKTAMLHLLLDKALQSSQWGPEYLADRLRDMLGLLKRSFQRRWLSHPLVGNPLIPQELGLPANVYQSKPINILQPVLNDGRLYTRTVQHFEEMLRNMPLLIQEYMKIQKVMKTLETEL